VQRSPARRREGSGSSWRNLVEGGSRSPRLECRQRPGHYTQLCYCPAFTAAFSSAQGARQLAASEMLCTSLDLEPAAWRYWDGNADPRHDRKFTTEEAEMRTMLRWTVDDRGIAPAT
jgi:hypothetical protein